MKKILLYFFIILAAPHISYAATIYANSSTGNDVNDGSVGSPVATFHRAYTLANTNDTIQLSGIFTLSSTTETGDAVTSGYTIAKSLEIVGDGADTTIIQSSTTTADRRVFTLSSAATTTIRNLTLRSGRVSSSNDGGCLLNSGTTTIINIEVYSCTNTADYGGGISNRGTMTISSSTIYSNTAYYGGGGLAQNFSATGNLIATNNTIYGNTVTSSGGAFYGAGVYAAGTKIVTLTNNTITANTNNSGLGSGLYAATTLYLKNNIIAANNASSYPANADYHYGSASTTSFGYNIIGRASTYNWASVGDWTDTNGDATFVLNTVGTTGTVRFDSALTMNDNPSKTKTLGILSGSIAINNGGTGTNSTTSVPDIDQRGATRNSSTDIGSFEYDGGGLSISAPSTQASGISFTLNEYNNINFTWTNGNGMRRVVFIKQANTGTASPVDGTRYTASTVFGSGDQIGSSGWYTLYDGYGTSTSVTGLTQSTSYIFQVFEYNGIGTGASKYNNTSATNNPNTLTTYTPTTLYINSSTGNDTTGTGSLGAPVATFHKGYTLAQSGDTLNLTGTFTWTDTAEAGDVTITGYTLTKDLTLIGQGAQNTIIQATSTDNTADRRIFTIANSTTTVTLKDLTLRYGKITSANGGCYSSTASTTMTNVEMYSCRSTGGYGGAVLNGGYININNSTFYSNTVWYGGGGIASYSTATNTIITNSTFYLNTVSANAGAFYGGGVYIGSGNSSLTNNTITANTNTNGVGGGLQFYNTNNYNYLKNNLIASNTASYYTSSSDFHTYTANSNITSNYNIIGRAESYGWSSTGDWTDSNGDRTFVLNTVGTTGTVNFDTVAGLNSSITGTKTWPVLVNSIAINRGTTGANGSSSVPTLDQRGAVRSGLTDIGSFEYGGTLVDTTGPVISLVASSTNTTTATVTWTTDENATSTIFYGPTSSYGSSSTTLVSGTSQSFVLSGLTSGSLYYFYASSTDQSGNTSTSSQYTFTTTDGTSPTVSMLVPTASEATSSTVTLAASASDNVFVAGVKFYIEGVLQGIEDTTSPYSISWDSTATTSGTKTVFAVARDSSNNYATSTSISFTVANTGATPSSISILSATTTAVITWTTSELASTKIVFGPTTSYGSTTQELDTSPRVTSHSMTLVQLPACSLINILAVSRTTVDAATSSNVTFTTKGCVGSAPITSSEASGIATISGGSISNDRLTLTVPVGFTSTSSSAVFQIHKLDATTFFSTAGGVSGKNRVGDSAFNLKAIIDTTTTLPTFSSPLTVTLTYENSDISRTNEDTLWIYRYDSGVWSPLSDCTVNKNSNSISCTTTQFSDFSIFGDEGSNEATVTSTVTARPRSSVTSQYNNLISLNLIKEANALKVLWPHLLGVNKLTRDLEFGMNREDVKELQEKLILKNTGPKARSLARVGPTGYFGVFTKEAVIEFQVNNKIYPPHGYFGPKTRAKFNL